MVAHEEAEEIPMSVMERRRGNPLADVFGWLDDADFPTLGLTPQIRIEDFVQDGSYVVRADIPGVDPDHDLHVSVDAGRLVVQGERREEERDKYRHEVRYGSFTRTLSLPSGVAVDDITARYQDGVLEVRFPMVEPASQARQVPVTRPEE
jgi:HSP20 family molecular chaperone IbpA